MNAGESPDRDLTAGELLLELLADGESRTARINYCQTVCSELEGVASWLAVDSWIGAGDIVDTAQPGPIDPERRDGFHGLSIVVQIASELASGARALIEVGRSYAAAALIRQLLECEYLLELFRQDFANATEWKRASPSELRRDYKVYVVRDLGQFSADEYGTHCERGGHPNPLGEYLLEAPNEIAKIRVPGDSTATVDRTDELWLDFAHHLQRIWTLCTVAIGNEHARFTNVRAEQLHAVADAEKTWESRDELASREARLRLMALVRRSPDVTLDDLTTT